ncbi:MAG: uracil-DNA glycosylase [Gemmatimonadota bacterium]
MDARERLRLYLEQRRDQGESDLVLDSMPVADVLRLLGAPGGAGPDAPAAPAPGGRTGRASRDDAPAAGGNWRETLTSIGAESGDVVPPAVSSVNQRDLLDSARVSATPPAAAPGQPIVIGRPVREFIAGPLASVDSLDALAAHIASCTGCSLARTARNHVPGEGSPAARFVVVGEAPGEKEDELGRPFVGRSGELLTKILEAVQLKREDVFICNVLKHRPPGNRNPSPDEITACSPYLLRQLELLQPRVILALGTFASQTLLQTSQPIGKLRGLVHRFHGVPLIVTYHPAALLRNPAWKRPTWEDVQLARRIFDSAVQA